MMSSIPSGASSFATWATNANLIVPIATIAFVMAGVMIWKIGAGLTLLFLAVCGTAIWSAAPDLARGIVNFFRGGAGGGAASIDSAAAASVQVAHAAASASASVLALLG